MKIALNTIKKIMQANLSKIINKEKEIPRPIENRALVLMSNHLTNYCAEITKQAEQLLLERNNLRDIQGISKKVRISEELIEEVLKQRSQNAKID
ncbi:MAG: hypothetical protein AB1485_08305 [Candidatus Thermoplasmatota archaeon]